MKAPKCPKCGKAHYSTQRCSAKEEESSGPKASVQSTSAVPADLNSPDSQDQSSAPSVSSPGSANNLAAEPTPPVPPADTSTSGGSITSEDLVSGGPTNPVHTFAEAKRVAEAYRESSSPLEDAPVSGSPVNGCREQGRKSPTGLSEGNEAPAGCLGGANTSSAPLTPAEKQKAYRKRIKDDPKAREVYLEANKLRMRAKRKNDDGDVPS